MRLREHDVPSRAAEAQADLPEPDRPLGPQRMLATQVRGQLVEALRRLIFEFRYRPGERLREQELCRVVGVSRTSLREALRQLESEGLIEIVANRGPIVREVSETEARQIYEIRALLEGFLARRAAARATKADKAELAATTRLLRAAVASRDMRQIIAVKSRIDKLMMAIADNHALTMALERLHGRVSLLRASTVLMEGRGTQSVAEIEAIMAAIASGDGDGAERAARLHIAHAWEVAALGFTGNREDAPLAVAPQV